MKRFVLVAAFALTATATAAHASTAPRAAKVHVVEGAWPSLTYTYAPYVIVHMAYPVEDGVLDRYAGSYDVAPGGALAAIVRAPDAIGEQKPGRVRLERKDGEKLWHVVAFTPYAP